MARPKKKTSETSFFNLGMKPEEDEAFIKLLEEKDLSARRLLRGLARQWMKEGGSNGVLRYK